jgi:glycosyltransferase involved in cell wall biosynthesis
MASGTPVLVSTDPALREVTGGAAVVVDPYSAESIAAGLWQLLTDRVLRDQLRQRGIVRSQAFTWERCAADTLALYHEVLGLAVSPQTAYVAP